MIAQTNRNHFIPVREAAVVEVAHIGGPPGTVVPEYTVVQGVQDSAVEHHNPIERKKHKLKCIIRINKR